ncbi:hypothetical protein [Kitasatospora sp. NPDC057541]|uniref:hypothetical protein n=1 Tax=unclassified Kitasatospora TaxID=2633591 RepID=UPI0036BC1A2A
MAQEQEREHGPDSHRGRDQDHRFVTEPAQGHRQDEDEDAGQAACLHQPPAIETVRFQGSRSRESGLRRQAGEAVVREVVGDAGGQNAEFPGRRLPVDEQVVGSQAPGQPPPARCAGSLWP